MTVLWIKPAIANTIAKQALSNPYGLLIGENNQILDILPKQFINADDLHPINIIGIFQTMHLDSTPIWDNIFVLTLTPELKAWKVQDGRVRHVAISINNEKPRNVETEELSIAQKNAIVIGGIIAFVLMIVLSIYLLPPAPPIP